MFDVPPTLPFPRQWHRSVNTIHRLEDAGASMADLRATWAAHPTLHQETEWLEIFNEMKTFSHDSFEGSVSTTAIVQHFAGEVGAWTNSTIHKLLTFRPVSPPLSFQTARILEACRLGGLLYMVPLWRYFGVAPVSSVALQTSLHSLLKDFDDDVTWGQLWMLCLWVLYVGAVEALEGPFEDWFLDQMVSVCMANGIVKWDEGMAVVKRVLWFPCIFGQRHVALQYKMRYLLEMKI